MPSAGGATQSQSGDKQNQQDNNSISHNKREGIKNLTTSGFYQCRPNTHNRPKRRRREFLAV